METGTVEREEKRRGNQTSDSDLKRFLNRGCMSLREEGVLRESDGKTCKLRRQMTGGRGEEIPVVRLKYERETSVEEH